jgi:hypothetical protein
MKNHSDSDGQQPARGDPQIPIEGANRLVAKFSRLYAEAAAEDNSRPNYPRGILHGAKFLK